MSDKEAMESVLEGAAMGLGVVLLVLLPFFLLGMLMVVMAMVMA